MKSTYNIRKKSFIIAVLIMNAGILFSQTITPWVTKGDQSSLLEPQTEISFSASSGIANATITLDPGTSYQTIDGFGFCLTQGSAQVISSLATTQQSELLNELFDTINGIGLSVIRISIGASDLSESDYSYNEVSGDTSMAHFSLAGPDSIYLIPILKKALAINPHIKILATPWTAPRWMKTNNAWIGGSLKTEYFNAYAKYFIKYFDAMKAQGINIWAITPQNEPLNAGNEPSMYMTSTDEKNFINNNLGPAMDSSGYSNILIIAYDHNCDVTDYPIDVASNSTYVVGSAFHKYGGDISAMTTVKEATNKNVYFTEQYTGANGSFSGDLGWHMQNVVIGSINNWSKTVIEWNLASNSSYGPRTAGGCSDCKGAYTIANSTTYSKNVSFYIIGQISKFVQSGAVRIKSTSSANALIVSAFKNPDNSYAALVYNGGSATSLKIVNGSNSVVYQMPASSAVTFTWSDAATAIDDFSNTETIYPNPANKYIILNAGNNKYRSIRVFDVTGKLVQHNEVQLENGKLKINIEPLSKGLYYLKLTGENHNSIQKFIKE